MHQKSESARQSIIETALAMFKKSGIKAITMDDIAAAMSISKRTIYELFNDKEDLVLQSIIYQNEKYTEEVTELRKQSTNTMEHIMRVYEKNIVMNCSTNPQFFIDAKKYTKVTEYFKQLHDRDTEKVLEFFRDGVQEGVFRSDINYGLLNLLLHKQFEFIFNSDVFEQYKFDEVYESIMLTMLRGISTEKGRSIIEDFHRSMKEKTEKHYNND